MNADKVWPIKAFGALVSIHSLLCLLLVLAFLMDPSTVEVKRRERKGGGGGGRGGGGGGKMVSKR